MITKYLDDNNPIDDNTDLDVLTDKEFSEAQDEISKIIKETASEVLAEVYEAIENDELPEEVKELENAKTLQERIEISKKYHPEEYGDEIK